jgi:phosphodiesterase/alkaline phosphatase D-like protein
MLGAEQRDWLLTDLATTKSRWNVLAQQTAFAPFNRQPEVLPRNLSSPDTWDSYVAERQQILDWIVAHRTLEPGRAAAGDRVDAGDVLARERAAGSGARGLTCATRAAIAV